MLKKQNRYSIYLITFISTITLFFIPFFFKWLENTTTFEPFINSLFSQGFLYHDAFKELITSEQLSTLFTQGQISLGKNFESMLIQYFGNFTNLLSLVVDQEHLPTFFFVLTATKVGFASMTFLYFIRAFESRKSFLQITFSVLYGLTGYGILYFINPLWIDTFMLFPLLILGVHHYVYKHTKKLFITTFLISVMNNPMNLDFLWISCSLYFLLQTCLIQSSKLKIECINYIKLFCWTIGFSAFILFPLTLTNPNFFNHNQSLTGILNLNWIASLLVGADSTKLFPEFSQTFLTIGVLIGCALFFTQRHRSNQEKCYYGIFLGIIFAFSSLQPLNTAHSLDNQTVIFNPYSIAFAFFIIWFAYRAFYHLNEQNVQNKVRIITLYGALTTTIILLAVNINLSVFKITSSLGWITINILICFIYYFIFKHHKKIFISLSLALMLECLVSQTTSLIQTSQWISENNYSYQELDQAETTSLASSLENWFRQETKTINPTLSPVTTLLTSSNETNLIYPLSSYFIENELSFSPLPNNYFENQNQYLQNIFNLKNNSENKAFLSIDSEIFSSQNLLVQSTTDTIELLNPEQTGTLRLRLYPNKNHELYIYLGNNHSLSDIKINNDSIQTNDLIYYKIKDSEEVVDILFTFSLEKKSFKFPKFAVLNKTFIENMKDSLNLNPFNKVIFQPNKIEGELTTPQSNYLLVNIPYHENWSAFINSKEVTIKPFNNQAMLIPIEATDESFVLYYHPKYLQIGIIVSSITMFCHLIRKWNKKRMNQSTN